MGAIDNKVAIVTGGGGGIGGAIVQRFAREGAKLAVADIDAEAAKASAANVAAQRADGMPIAADVTDKSPSMGWSKRHSIDGVASIS